MPIYTVLGYERTSLLLRVTADSPEEAIEKAKRVPSLGRSYYARNGRPAKVLRGLSVPKRERSRSE